MMMRREWSAQLTTDSHINARRSPTAGRRKPRGRLVHALLDLGPRWGDSEPHTHDPLDRPKLCTRESSQCADQLGVRNCYEILGIEYTSTKERNPDRHFESGTPRTRRVRNEGDERAVTVARRHADDHRRPDLGGHPEVHQPDLAPLRGFHYDCSW